MLEGDGRDKCMPLGEERIFDPSVRNLSNLNLGGEISPAIGDLKNLQFMDFQGNKLTGQIPDEIGNCVSLMLGILPRILINYNSHVLNHALSGIAVSMVMKYADNIDNIVKVYSTSVAMLLTAVVSVFLFGFHLSLAFFLGST